MPNAAAVGVGMQGPHAGPPGGASPSAHLVLVCKDISVMVAMQQAASQLPMAVRLEPVSSQELFFKLGQLRDAAIAGRLPPVEMVLLQPNLLLEDFNLAAKIKAQFGLPTVMVQGDAQVAATFQADDFLQVSSAVRCAQLISIALATHHAHDCMRARRAGLSAPEAVRI